MPFYAVAVMMSLISCLSLDTWSHIMLTHISPHSIEPQCCFYFSYCLSERVFAVVLFCWLTILICFLILYAFLAGAKLQATNHVPRPVDRGTATRYGG